MATVGTLIRSLRTTGWAAGRRGSDLPGEPQFTLGHRPSLDGFRGVAVLMVMIGHLPVIDANLGFGVLPGGYLGVDLFFVLSGFLITTLLCQEFLARRQVSYRSFYQRRALRLLPALLAVMVVQLIYTLVVHDGLSWDLEGLAFVLFYVANWSAAYGGPIPYGLGPTWSLSVEEQFYLAWPLVFVTLLRSGRRRIVLGGILGIALLSMFVRAGMYHHYGRWLVVYLQTETRFDDLMVGAGAAFLLQMGWKPGRWVRSLGLVAAPFLVVCAFTVKSNDWWLYYFGFTVIALAAGCALLASLEEGSPLFRLLSVRPLRTVGLLSYSLYLWHFAIFSWIPRAWPHASPWLLIPLCYGLSFVAAVLSYRYVERPFLRIKRRHSVVDPISA